MTKFKKPYPKKGRPESRPESSGARTPRFGKEGSRPFAGSRPADHSHALPKGRIAVGIHAVREALKVRPKSISALWLREKHHESQALSEIADLAAQRKVAPTTKPVGVLDRILSTHQGVVAFLSEDPVFDRTQAATSDFSTVLVLDGVEDPHNLGAVLRTAWLLGAEAVFVPDVRATAISPAVSKVAQGACEHVPVLVETSLSSVLEDLKSKGYWVLGLSHKADQSLYSAQIPEKVVWVLGSESHGIRKPLERLCDSLVSIPQSDPEASYNVSVAAALALGETFRQRRSFGT